MQGCFSWSNFQKIRIENENVEYELHGIELNEQTETDCSDKTQNSLNYPEGSSHFHMSILSDDEINSKIRSRNLKQWQIFDFILNWEKLHVKVKSGKTKKQSTSFHLFLSGIGGCGKSHLIQTIFHAVSKVFLYQSGDPSKSRVLLLAPTGVAAININGNAIHPGFHIRYRGKILPLNDASKAELRNKYSEVELIIIDEISMVSNKLFYQVHKNMNEIFCPGQDFPFGRKSVIICGDMYQLPPVRAKPVFIFNETETMEGFISSDI